MEYSFWEVHTITSSSNNKILDRFIKYDAKLKLYDLNLRIKPKLGKIYNSPAINPMNTTCKND